MKCYILLIFKGAIQCTANRWIPLVVASWNFLVVSIDWPFTLIDRLLAEMKTMTLIILDVWLKELSDLSWILITCMWNQNLIYNGCQNHIHTLLWLPLITELSGWDFHEHNKTWIKSNLPSNPTLDEDHMLKMSLLLVPFSCKEAKVCGLEPMKKAHLFIVATSHFPLWDLSLHFIKLPLQEVGKSLLQFRLKSCYSVFHPQLL